MSSRFVLALVLTACAAPVPAPPVPTPTCGGATAPSPVTLVAGGRTRLTLSDTLAAEALTVNASPGVSVVREDDVVTLVAGYEPATATLTFVCTDGSLEAPVTIEALRFDALLDWDASETAPAGREYFAMWMDPGGARALYVYGGFVYEPVQFTPSTELWRLDLSTLAWATIAQEGTSPPPGGRVAPGETGMLYFGGASVTAEGALDTPPALVALASGEPATWSPAARGDTGPGSYTGSFVYDSARERWLSVCGADTRTLGLHCLVHAYAPETGFVEVDVEGDAPQGRYGFHYAYDEETERVIVFGGQVGSGNTDMAGDTWALELAPDDDDAHPRWTRLFESSEGISPRRNGAYALDPEGHRFFVWGGTSDGATAVPGLDVLSLEPGAEAWTHVSLPDAVPSRASGAGVYDAVGHRVLWGFGNERAVYTDLYALALAPNEAP